MILYKITNFANRTRVKNHFRVKISPIFWSQNLAKHEGDRYLNVDETNKWQVSNGEELYGLSVRQVACSRFGYVHGGQVPAGDVPVVDGWKYYVSDEKRWVDDRTLTVACEH